MKLAKNLDRLGTETAFSVLAEAKKLEAQGKEMIHLGLGQPDFMTPKHIMDAAKKLLMTDTMGMSQRMEQLNAGKQSQEKLKVYIKKK